MFTKREGLIERTEIEVRQRALKSLVLKRNKLLRESLDQRIKRAGKEGVWSTLSRSECRELHRQEIAHLRVQLADLHLEWAHTRLELKKLKRALTRAERLKAIRRTSVGHPLAAFRHPRAPRMTADALAR